LVRDADGWIDEAKKLRKIRICRWCLGRLHSSDVESVEAVGSRAAAEMGIYADDAGCQLCGGMFSRLEWLVDEAVEKLSGVELRSFYVSVSVPYGMREMEDELRARLRLSGGISAKRLAIRMISKKVEERLGVPARSSDPDVILEFTPDGLRGISLMPMYLEGRYVKPAEESVRGARGESQALESEISRSLVDAFAADGARIMWLGTDFRGVEVVGRGRPFMAKVSGARRRVSWLYDTRMTMNPHVLAIRELRDQRKVAMSAEKSMYDVVSIDVGPADPPGHSGRGSFEEVRRRLEELEGSELSCGTGRARRILRAVTEIEEGTLRALMCVEHGIDVQRIPECATGEGWRASRVRVLDVVEDCLGYPLGWYVMRGSA
jgi:hypothetical protein